MNFKIENLNLVLNVFNCNKTFKIAIKSNQFKEFYLDLNSKIKFKSIKQLIE